MTVSRSPVLFAPQQAAFRALTDHRGRCALEPLQKEKPAQAQAKRSVLNRGPTDLSDLQFNISMINQFAEQRWNLKPFPGLHVR